jgi:hypothetical protein
MVITNIEIFYQSHEFLNFHYEVSFLIFPQVKKYPNGFTDQGDEYVHQQLLVRCRLGQRSAPGRHAGQDPTQ